MPGPAQAADHFLRQHGNWLDVNALRLEQFSGQEPSWQVSFQVMPTGQKTSVEVTLEPEVFEVYLSSGETEMGKTGQYHCQLLDE
jgi:hypothetical protein